MTIEEIRKISEQAISAREENNQKLADKYYEQLMTEILIAAQEGRTAVTARRPSFADGIASSLAFNRIETEGYKIDHSGDRGMLVTIQW
jgi:hypothetical protein